MFLAHQRHIPLKTGEKGIDLRKIGIAIAYKIA
jgi:hypothetical protein